MTAIARDWFKACTNDLDDPRFVALTMEQRGVLDSVLKLQAKISSAPGTLLSPMGHAMTEMQIAIQLGIGSEEGCRVVAETFNALRASGLLLFDEEAAVWIKPDWLERHSFESQHAAIREANRQRKAAERARKKAAARGHVGVLRRLHSRRRGDHTDAQSPARSRKPSQPKSPSRSKVTPIRPTQPRPS